MSERTSIEWTDATWNPVRGCSRVSEGCRNCYAEKMAARFSDEGGWGHGFAERTESGGRWTGKVELVPEKLAEPLSWRKPRMCFVNSTSDLFHESIPFEDIAAVYGVMMACQHITFQILTKRAWRRSAFHAWITRQGDPQAVCEEAAMEVLDRTGVLVCHLQAGDHRWPLPNVWEGVSAENQAAAEQRIPHLLDCAAAVRFVSLEPLLGPIDLRRITLLEPQPPFGPGVWLNSLTGHVIGPDDILPNHLDWVIAGGESGHGARPMHPAWVRALRDQCIEAGVPFFFKQWGSYKPVRAYTYVEPEWLGSLIKTKAGNFHAYPPASEATGFVIKGGSTSIEIMVRTAKRRAGKMLDGRTWAQMPEVRPL